MSRITIGVACDKHGFQRGSSCPRCDENAKRTDEIRVNTGDWVKGWYEHIDPSGPIYIESKKQLIYECEKRGLLARSLMKPKSQGQGYEHRH